MRTFFVSTCLALCVACAACGGGTEAGAPVEPSDAGTAGSASVDGAVQGAPIPTTTTAAILDGTHGLRVVMNNLEDACSPWKSGGGNGRGLRVFTLAVTAGGQPVGPGSYPIELHAPATGPYAEASYSAFDDSCQSTGVVDGAGGQVTVETVSASLVTGSFDVTLGTGDHVTGTFSAPVCDAPATADAAPPCGS